MSVKDGGSSGSVPGICAPLRFTAASAQQFRLPAARCCREQIRLLHPPRVRFRRDFRFGRGRSRCRARGRGGGGVFADCRRRFSFGCALRRFERSTRLARPRLIGVGVSAASVPRDALSASPVPPLRRARGRPRSSGPPARSCGRRPGRSSAGRGAFWGQVDELEA